MTERDPRSERPASKAQGTSTAATRTATAQGSQKAGASAPTVGGLLHSIYIGKRHVQIQVEYTPKPEPHIVAVAAWEGKVLMRRDLPLDRALDEHDKDRMLATCSHAFVNALQEMLLRRAKERQASQSSVPPPLTALNSENGAALEAVEPSTPMEHFVEASDGPYLADLTDPLGLLPLAEDGGTTFESRGPAPAVESPDAETQEVRLGAKNRVPELGALAPREEPDRAKGIIRAIAELPGVRLSALIRDGDVQGLTLSDHGDPRPADSITRLWWQLRSRLGTLGKHWQLGRLVSYVAEYEDGFLLIIPVPSLGCFAAVISAEQSPAVTKKSIARIVGGGEAGASPVG